jgi:transposase-like protein
MTGHSNQTVSAFTRFYRQLVTSAFHPESSIIGGNGVIVEIDESKFGKRKYHRGHHVDGTWVVGGIERTSEKKVFLVPVESRDARTLLDVISSHVLPGSIVYTDMWKSYASINEVLGLEHFTVNHSIHFKDPQTGVHTNTVEGLWNGIKLGIKPRNREKDGMDEHLMEFIWRRINKNTLWDSLLTAMNEIHYE